MLLHVLPPRRDLRAAVVRALPAEHRRYHVQEEEGRDQRAISEGEGAADGIGSADRRFELIEPRRDLRQLLGDELRVLLGRRELRKERAQRRLEVEIEKAARPARSR